MTERMKSDQNAPLSICTLRERERARAREGEWFLHPQAKCTATAFENLETKMADNMAEEGDVATENTAETEEKVEYPLEVQYCGGNYICILCYMLIL